MKKLIVFTGGHHNGALEFAKFLKKKGYRTLWLGHKYNIGGKKSISGEYYEVKAESISFKELTTGRFYKKLSPYQILLIIFGFFQSAYYLIKYKPDLIYSSGGFMAVPVVIVGYILGIPSVTHEQTVVAGWANKTIAPFVKKIFLTHTDLRNQFPKAKSVVVGLPLNSQLLKTKNTKKLTSKIIFITSGKQGSEIINQAILPLVAKLVKNYTVIHQVGSNADSLKIAKNIKQSLGSLSHKYYFTEYFYNKDQATYLRSAEVIICRAGAHTIYELVALNKKAIIIPIPWVSHQEQMLNAKHAQKMVGSLILEEKDLSPSTLNAKIDEAMALPNRKLPLKITNEAVEKIFLELEKMALL